MQLLEVVKELKILVFTTLISCVLIKGEILNKSKNLQPFELNEFLQRSFVSKSWNGTWITDNTFLAKNEDNNLYQVKVDDLNAELFLKADVFEKYPGNTISVSPDLQYVLIRYNQKSIFRHSTTAQFAIYEIASKKYYDVANKKHLQFAKWAPVKSSLIYILENNIYYIRTIADVEKAIQITSDGVPGIVYNGVPDWVYEEEVLASGSALWFSPNGERLAFASFDDTKVKEFRYFIYGDPTSIDSQYPQSVLLKYPKVGTANPRVTVKYVDLQDPEEVHILKDIIPTNVVSNDHILRDITWATNIDIVAVSLNRVQNIAATIRYNVENQKYFEVYIAKENNGWLDINAPLYSEDGKQYVILSSEPEEDDFYKHIVLIDETAIPKRKRLTYGKRIVSTIYGWDQKRQLIYYVGTVIDKPSQQQVYVYNLKTDIDECITCYYKTPEGPCQVAAASFSKAYSHFAHTCSGSGPNLVLVINSQSRNYFVWEENSNLRKKLSNKLKPVRKDLTVTLKSGFTVRVRLLLPPQLNENSDEKYPMVVNVYAGPNSNRISDAYSVGVENYFVTNRQYIYAYIDGRGCGKNGNNLMFQVYRKLGTVEIEDQIEVTKYLQSNYSYIDASRTGIWGWSYGGFSTIWTLIKDKENVFKFGLAVAPVTNFIYYDSIYTERYMGLPTVADNIEGYRNTDTIRNVEALRNKTFFLIHGNADDNVHYQQSMLLSKVLERSDIMFYQQSYPDENHSLGGVSRHLYHTIDRFFYNNLKKPSLKKFQLRKDIKTTNSVEA